MQCPICKKELKNAAGFGQHAKRHVEDGELVRRDVIQPEHGNTTKGYAWSGARVYVKTRKPAKRRSQI